MAFHPDELLHWLPDKQARCLVAYSGGMDSHVLLHAMAGLRDAGTFTGQLEAIHVNHGLNPLADDWTGHCHHVCDGLGIVLHDEKVAITNRGQGIEQAARDARYAVFSTYLHTGDYLLTAHHLDDQAETLLFRLLRGTGLRGLAGIRRQRALAAGTLVRPLLDYTRNDLLAYGEAQNLAWVEDDSNSDERLDRNYLRHRIIPALAERWPGFRKSWQRLAGLAAEAQALLEEVGREDLEQVGAGDDRVSLAALGRLSEVRQHNVLRSWMLALENTHGIPAPDAYVMDRIFSELIPAQEDAEPVVSWQKGGRIMEFRRFAGHIHAVMPPVLPAMTERLAWRVSGPMTLPAGLGTLELVESAEDGFLLPAGGELSIGFRQGGERVKPAGRKTRPLKKILQEFRVPPWLRDTVPLIYHGDDLVAVADLFLCEPWQMRKAGVGNEKLFRIRWQRAELHCGY